MNTQSLDWGFAKFAPLDSLTASKGFLDKEGDIEATVRVVADFPTYKTSNMPTGSNRKGKRTARRECKKEKSPEEEDVKDTVSIVYSLIVEVLDEVVAWGFGGDYCEDGLSSSSEGSEVSDGDSENSESSENISDGELEWLARDLREFLALPEKKSMRMEMGSKARCGRRILKEGLGQVQQELEQRRRGKKRQKTSCSGRYQRPGYTLIDEDTFLRVRRRLSFKALGKYIEEDDENYVQPDCGEILDEKEEEDATTPDETVAFALAPDGTVAFAPVGVEKVRGDARFIKDMAKRLGNDIRSNGMQPFGKHEEKMLGKCLAQALNKWESVQGDNSRREGLMQEVGSKGDSSVTTPVHSKDLIRGSISVEFRGWECTEEEDSTKEEVVPELEEETLDGAAYGQGHTLAADLRIHEATSKETLQYAVEEENSCQNVAHGDGNKASMNPKDTKDLTSPCKLTLGTILEEDEGDTEVEVENTLHETELVSIPSSPQSQFESDYEHGEHDESSCFEKATQDGATSSSSIKEQPDCTDMEENKENNKELRECGINASPLHSFPEEVVAGLRGLDGAILLLQKARHELLRQVIGGQFLFSEFNSQVGAHLEAREVNVGKCYKPGCLKTAKHKCPGCFQVLLVDFWK